MAPVKKLMFGVIFLLLVAGGFYFFQNKDAFLGSKVANPPAETKCPEPVPVFCPAPTPSPAKETPSLLEIAISDCRIYGTFQPGDFGNIENLMPTFSEDFKNKMTGWIAAQKSKSRDAKTGSPFDKVVTLPVEGKTIFSDDQNGGVVVKTNRLRQKNNSTVSSSSENCTVDFKKAHAKWEIDNIGFLKSE